MSPRYKKGAMERMGAGNKSEEGGRQVEVEGSAFRDVNGGKVLACSVEGW